MNFVLLGMYQASAFAIEINPAPHEDGSTPIIASFPVDVNGLVAWVITAFGIIAILAALVWLILGAIKWIISGGDKEKVAAARGQIIAAIIGLIIVILSLVIINFVISFFVPGSNIWNLQIPTFEEAIKDNG